MYIEREISDNLKAAITQFPVVFLTGPRQSGKTTLLKRLMPDYDYVNLEDPDLRSWAISQPVDFLRNNPWPLIIDEAQYAPDLFSHIQLVVDDESQTGMFILSGSQNFLMMERIRQTLAGRSAILTLLPFSAGELSDKLKGMATNDLIINGFYPRLFETVSDSSLFYRSYLNTYIERDVRQLSNIGSLNDFARFMKLCAGRCGQLLNISSLSTEAGLAYNTCKSWLSYLSTGHIIKLLQPYYRNFNKKIVKSPKLYFTDTGLLTYLLGISNSETLAVHPLRGAVFENLVYSEILKSITNKGDTGNIWYWRDNHGTEVDFLIENGVDLSAMEVKSATNFHEEYLRNLIMFRKYNPSVSKVFLLYDGTIERKVKDVSILNWRNKEYLQ